MKSIRISPRILVPVFVFGLILSLFLFKTGKGDGFWVGCLWFRLTGLHCSGCGNSRAVVSLLDGEFLRAWKYNLVGFPIVLIGLAVYLRSGWISMRCNRWIWPRFSNRLGWYLLILASGWMILRNLPWHPFVLLAP